MVGKTVGRSNLGVNVDNLVAISEASGLKLFMYFFMHDPGPNHLLIHVLVIQGL